ncbi:MULTISPECIES: glycosyltransferase family 61 protein [Arthrospira]|nr:MULTISPECIES: glycosyltransferase family 61 protein [Arthrospira]AMW28495.1 hypothetical protein AP285_11470 [Arthrospira platensis YZ]MDT9298182.1 glycosyltransferase family 61 protein [Arthrospira platensis PCC 7345]MDT9309422.1 glycosyltransferase family 61 protein [Limnospira sp. Paracas R14]QQW31290.1 glycosyltransferase family 61 protein [Arthrospira sp. PCC 9108]MBD2572314.1 glycosyltransferase family 61 protein [Arthrospira platensis FACHB-971]
MKKLTKILSRLLIQKTKIEYLYKKSSAKHLICENYSRPTPETAEMNFWLDAQYLQQPEYRLPDIYSVTLENVIYSPRNNLLLSNFPCQIIADSLPTPYIPKNPTVLADIYLRKTAKISGICTVFVSYYQDFYHQIIDNIPRLYLLQNEEYAKLESIQIICPRLTPFYEFVLPKIIPENARIIMVEEHKNYRLEKLIFTSFLTKFNSGFLPKEYLSFFAQKVYPERPRKKQNRIFISRQKAANGKRNILNEEELFEILRKFGFQKYFLEEMTIREQMDLFYDAEIVVGAHGAGLTNIIYSDKINVIEIFGTKFIWAPNFYFLAKSMNHNYYYLCSDENLDYNDPNLWQIKLSTYHRFKDRDFMVNVSKVKELLSSIL